MLHPAWGVRIEMQLGTNGKSCLMLHSAWYVRIEMWDARVERNKCSAKLDVNVGGIASYVGV